MREYAVAEKILDENSLAVRDLDRYYSVEIPVKRLGIVYQFKIWRTESTSMFVLVKEESSLLFFLKAGDRLNMKYYSNEFIYHCENLETEILNITKQDYGRFKGHYVVGLGIRESRDRGLAPWDYGSYRDLDASCQNGDTRFKSA
jgi:hypothetical protein